MHTTCPDLGRSGPPHADRPPGLASATARRYAEAIVAEKRDRADAAARLFQITARAREEFLQSGFSDAGEIQQFRSAELSNASWRVLLRKLERMSAEFRDLAEIDRSLPSREKRSVAIYLAGRPWVFSLFGGSEA